MGLLGGLPLSYCMNVHGGCTFEDLLSNLKIYANNIRIKSCECDEPMGVGLWLSHDVLDEVVADWTKVNQLKTLLGDLNLVAYTFNGFPYGNFHETVVKHKVYHPRWDEQDRLSYTKNLAKLLAGLLDEGESGSISTLPLGWREDIGEAQLAGCVINLLDLADFLKELEEETGKYIYLTIEPEPGCYLDKAEDLVTLFKEELFTKGDKAIVQRYLQVCHDVCHAAVVYENQNEVWQRYEDTGISVGKVQLSSAVKVVLENQNKKNRSAIISELAVFSEDRYLHQSGVIKENGDFTLYEDLPSVLCDENVWVQAKELRVHFHVPLFVEKFGLLNTTQDQLKACLDIIKQKTQTGWAGHIEVETYAWGVLPEKLQEQDLATGIAKEMIWVKTYLSQNN